MIVAILAILTTPYDHLLEAPHPLYYACAIGTPSIDGKLADIAWNNARWTESFVDIEGPKKPSPRFRTRAKMLWDEKAFYIAAEMEEPHVWSTLTEHDSVIFHDNDFEVFIDTDGDNHNYFEFEINSLNTCWDLRLPKPYRDGGPALNEWEIPGLRTAVSVNGTLNNPRDTDLGWTVEIAIPWEAVGGKPGEGDIWRINFSRVEWQVDTQSGKYMKGPGVREDNWVWSPQHVIDMHQPQLWGYVGFSGEPQFVDPTHAARMALHHVYYRQKAHLEKHGEFASNIAQLDIDELSGFLRPPRIHLTPDGYWASGIVQTAAGPAEIAIRQDSLIRVLKSTP